MEEEDFATVKVLYRLEVLMRDGVFEFKWTDEKFGLYTMLLNNIYRLITIAT